MTSVLRSLLRATSNLHARSRLRSRAFAPHRAAVVFERNQQELRFLFLVLRAVPAPVGKKSQSQATQYLTPGRSRDAKARRRSARQSRAARLRYREAVSDRRLPVPKGR